MKKRFLFLAAIAAFLFFWGCKKNDSTPQILPQGTNKQVSISQIFSSNAPKPQNFTISADNGGTITGAEGTILSFPANAFVDKNGKAITGSVNIQLTEVLTKSDMIFSGVYTLSNGNALISGGMYKVLVTQNGNNIQLKNGTGYSASLPIPSNETANTGMSIFSGRDSAKNTINWVKVNPAKIIGKSKDSIFRDSLGNYDTITINGDTIYHDGVVVKSILNTPYYFSLVDSLKWANIDRYISYNNYSQFTTITVTSPSNFADSNVNIYIIFNQYRCIWQFYSTSITHQFQNSEGALGMNATILTVASNKTGLYYSLTPITITANMTVNVTVSPTTQADLVSAIKALK